MKVVSLGSGSSGNATLIEAGGVRVLLDCGFGIRELERRCREIAVDLQTIDAVLLTHEHQDHAGGVARLAARIGLPVYLTAGTFHALEERWRDNGPPINVIDWRLLDGYAAFNLGNLRVQPVVVPHDAREPCQFTFASSAGKIGILTDLGMVTPHVMEQFAECDGLLLECNHDLGMLREGPYPSSLKARVGGNYGHLSNRQAAAFVAALETARVQWLVAMHLSEQNNTPALARAALLEYWPDEQRLHCAGQHAVSAEFALA